jgi:hypothetical protein
MSDGLTKLPQDEYPNPFKGGPWEDQWAGQDNRFFVNVTTSDNMAHIYYGVSPGSNIGICQGDAENREWIERLVKAANEPRLRCIRCGEQKLVDAKDAGGSPCLLCLGCDLLLDDSDVELQERDAAEQSESPVLLDALRKLHSPYGIYDACEHDHKDGDPDAIQVDEIGLTCSAAKLYDICNACCGPGESDYQSLECAENHEHGPDIPICSTVALLASFQAKGHDPAEVRDRIAFAIWKSYWPDQTEDWIREHWQANATIKGDKVQRVPYILADVVIEEMGSALWLKR